MPTGQKHLVECNCILPQFRRQPDPPFHRFVVFSQIEDDGTVTSKWAQCNNCGAIHKVVDVCKSEIQTGREQSSAVLTIDDIRHGISKELADVLEKHSVDVATWEFAQFVIENSKWGESVLLSSEMVDGERQGKMLRILGNTLFKIVPFSYTNVAG